MPQQVLSQQVLPRKALLQNALSHRMSTLFCMLCLLLGLLAGPATFASDGARPAKGHVDPTPDIDLALKASLTPKSHVACVGGTADGYPCSQVDLMSFLPLSTIGGGSGSDIWGWTHESSGREFALMGRSNGTAFIEITDPENPVYLGNLPTAASTSAWRDIKVHADHALIVADNAGAHGLQVFHLEDLLNVVSPPVTFTATGSDDGFGRAHNIVVNEDSGFAYIVGADVCSGGLHVLDVSHPDEPTFAGCFSADGYTHDAQCVNYAGPDADHTGKEICFNYNEDTLTIVDVSNKASMTQISRTGYSGSSYTHQGWLTDDHAYLLMDDEGDEGTFGHNTKTYIWDVRDLDAPVVIGEHLGPDGSTDHNQYVHQGYVYQANYRAGLRILSIAEIATGSLVEAAYFDTVPPGVSSSGAWSVYPYFSSGNVIVSGISEGLFVLRPSLCDDPALPTGLAAVAGGDNTIDLTWDPLAPLGDADPTIEVYRALGACGASGEFTRIAEDLTGTSYSDVGVSGQVPYAYEIRRVDATGFCASQRSLCASATTSGACTAGPSFAGVNSVDNLAQTTCGLQIGWNEGTANCGGALSYNVYRSDDPNFLPAPENRIAAGLAGLSLTDTEVVDGTEMYYIVRAVDMGIGAEDDNLVRLSATPTGTLSNGTWTAGAEIGDVGMIYGTEFGTEHIGWEVSTERFLSGSRSYFSTYGSNQCAFMATPPLMLTPGEAPLLSFSTVYDIEVGWDGGVVQISVDEGPWETLDVGYPGDFINSSDACGFSAGDPSFTGIDLTWRTKTADLTGFAGDEVQIRWIFSTDGYEQMEGWYVDDLEITHVQTPSSCVSLGIFNDGFESSDTSSWSSQVP